MTSDLMNSTLWDKPELMLRDIYKRCNVSGNGRHWIRSKTSGSTGCLSLLVWDVENKTSALSL
jgi:hypothetical protein